MKEPFKLLFDSKNNRWRCYRIFRQYEFNPQVSDKEIVYEQFELVTDKMLNDFNEREEHHRIKMLPYRLK